MTEWKETTEKWYWYSLEVLPPADMKGGAFLVGEPTTHRTCKVTGVCRPTYAAFLARGISGPAGEKRNEKFYTAGDLTVPEFRQAIYQGVNKPIEFKPQPGKVSA